MTKVFHHIGLIIALGACCEANNTHELTQQCSVKKNTDVAVTHYKRIAAQTVGDCCAACTADPKCKVAVFYEDHCNLKDQVRLVTSSSDFVTVIPGESPSPAPAPSPTPTQQCSVKNSTDVAVTHYKRIAAQTVGDCCDACTADRQCKVAVFHGDHCNLKDEVRLVDSSSDFVTVFPGESPSPAPAPTPAPPGPAGDIECGAQGSIWGTEMGDTGACDCMDHPQMHPDDKAHWTCSKTGDIALDLSGMADVQKCMSYSTEGHCEFRQRDLKAVQVTLDSSDCDSLWVAPLWIAPESWKRPQSQTGEVDIFERGCARGNGYVLSLGLGNWLDAWNEDSKPNAKSSFTAYLEFNRDVDTITSYLCPRGANPMSDGTGRCIRTHSDDGYFRHTAGQTRNGEEYMHLVSDIWNGCHTRCSRKVGGESRCNFKVSNLKLRLTGPFRRGSVAACDSLLAPQSVFNASQVVVV